MKLPTCLLELLETTIFFEILARNVIYIICIPGDACQTAPNKSVWLCSPSTLGIFFDPETQRCRYMGCSNRKLFLTLEDCEKICNNPRHIKRRNQAKANETSH